MSFVGILIATGIIGVVGLLIGLFLGIAGIKFKVDVDEREEAVLAALPGNNCGGAAVRVLPDLLLRSQREKPRSMPVRSAVNRSVKRSVRSWAFRSENPDVWLLLSIVRAIVIRQRWTTNTQAHRTVICFPLYRTEVRRPVTMAVSVTEAVSRLVRLMRSMW